MEQGNNGKCTLAVRYPRQMIPVSVLHASLHVHAGALEWKNSMHVPNYYYVNEVKQT